MGRILAILFGVVIVALAGGFLALGAYPPRAPVQAVHESVSTDRLEQANAPPVPVLPPVPIPSAPAAPVPIPPLPTPSLTAPPTPAPVPTPVPAAPGH